MSNVALLDAGETEDLSCVMIPTLGEQLLLPNICVAEIVPWRRLKVAEDGPEWLMGYVGWRGQTIPVLHFAQFAGSTAPADGQPRCLVVMNRSRTPSAPAFYALAAEGLPRMLQLAEDDLSSASTELSVAQVMRVNVGTEVATIPDLAYVEEQVLNLRS
ncbi:MAG: chemotaxis protein CheW [Pseudomonadota bacterium]